MRGASLVAAVLLTLSSCSERGDSAGQVTPSPVDTGIETETGTETGIDTGIDTGNYDRIYVAADHRGGRALTDRLSSFQAEFHYQQRDIYLSRPGKPVRRVVATARSETCPRVSPDGQRLAYLEGKATVVVATLDAEGEPSDPQLRTRLSGASVGCPEWAPDARSLGYLVVLGRSPGLYETRPTEMHTLTLDGQDRVVVSFETQTWHEPVFAWSPAGDEIAYTTERGLWRIRVAGGKAEPVWRPAEGDPSQELPMAFDRPTSVTWLSKSTIAFTVYASEADRLNDTYGTGTETRTVQLIHLGSGRVRRLETFAGAQALTWSPDGSRFASTGDRGRILVHDRVSGVTTRMNLTPAGEDHISFGFLAWSPDGQELLALARAGQRGYALASLASDGSSVEMRTHWTWALDWTTDRDVSWSNR